MSNNSANGGLFPLGENPGGFLQQDFNRNRTGRDNFIPVFFNCIETGTIVKNANYIRIESVCFVFIELIIPVAGSFNMTGPSAYLKLPLQPQTNANSFGGIGSFTFTYMGGTYGSYGLTVYTPLATAYQVVDLPPVTAGAGATLKIAGYYLV